MELGYLITDLYKMDMKELRNTLISRRRGLAYQLWKQMILNRYILATKVSDIPKTPEEASPELYPPKKTYAMPDFLKEKYERREASRIAAKEQF